MNNGSKNLKGLYEIINNYRNMMVQGERIELIITPNRNNPTERIITIGIQNGLSRDRETFLVNNGEYFDKYILSDIINYYSQDDVFEENSKIIRTTLPNQTSKAVFETESSNLLYIETFDNNLFDRLKGKKEEPKEFERVTLSQEQKDWNEIIYYAKERRITEDYVNRNNLTARDVVSLDNLFKYLSKNKKFVPGYSKEKLQIVKDNLEKLLKSEEWTDELINIGIDSDTYERAKEILEEHLPKKLIGTVLTDKFARILQSEKRITEYKNKRIKDKTFNIEEFEEKVEFATKELEKVGYFELKNASFETFLNYSVTKKYGNTLPNAIMKLKERYNNKEDIDIVENGREEQYSSYCNELIAYLETNALANEVRKRKQKEPNVNIKFLPYKENINSEIEQEIFDNLLENIELCKNARINDELFELIIEQDKENLNKRIVRLSITNGMSRRDDFEYVFENGENFDKLIPQLIQKVSENDKVFTTDESIKDTKLIKTESGNEILIKGSYNQQENNNELEELKSKLLNNEISEETYKKLITILQARIKQKEQEVEKKQPKENKEKTKKDLTDKDKELISYFRLKLLRDNGQLPPIGIKEIERLASINEKIATIENARIKFLSKEISEDTYKKIETTYKAELRKTIKSSNQVDKTVPLISPTVQKLRKKSLNLPEEVNQLAQYFRIEVLRNKNQLNYINIEELEHLIKVNEKVAILEEAHKKVDAKEMTQEEFDNLHEQYRLELVTRVQQSIKKNNLFDEIKGKNIEITLEEIDKRELEKNKKEAPKPNFKDLENILVKKINEKLTKPETKQPQEKTEFDELHELFIKYKLKNENGETKVYNRETSIEYFADKKTLSKIVFANFWGACAGLKISNEDIEIGEKYAFNDESKELYNIMNIQYKESLLRGIPIDHEELKIQFENTHHEKNTEIYDRLFSNPYYREFISNYYEYQLKDILPKKEPKKENIKEIQKEISEPERIEEEIKELKEIVQTKEQEEVEFIEEEIKELKEIVQTKEQDEEKDEIEIIEEEIQELKEIAQKTEKEELENLKTELESYIEEEPKQEKKLSEEEKNQMIKELEKKINEVLYEQKMQEIKQEEKLSYIYEIRDTYEVAADCATLENPASLKIFFQKDNPDNVEIIISNGHGEDEEVLYQKEFSKEEVMGEMLEEICNVYIKENGITYNQTFQVPNTNKAGSITLGKNDNVLQMSNAPKECVKELQKYLDKLSKSNKESKKIRK